MAVAVVYAGVGLEREVGSFEETLFEVTQRSLHDTANWVASAAERELREKFRHVQTAAGTPELQRLLADFALDKALYAEMKSELAAHDTAAWGRLREEWPPLPNVLRPLQSWISADLRWESEGVAARDGHLGPPLWEYDPDEVAENVLGWWVCGPDGYQLARDPWEASRNRDFAFRSYFTGLDVDGEKESPPKPAWQPGDGPRLSAVFHTLETDYYVLAISAPVWDSGQFVGVVGTFLGLGSLLERPDDNEVDGAVRYAVLLDPRPDSRVAKIIEHPYHNHPSALRDGRFPAEVATTTETRDQWEARVTEDPFGQPNFGAVEEYGGRWHTAWARVRIPDGSGNDLVALVRESQQLVSRPSRRLRTNLRWLGVAVVGLFVFPLIPLLLLLPDRRRKAASTQLEIKRSKCSKY
jgi:hypothetical protein